MSDSSPRARLPPGDADTDLRHLAAGENRVVRYAARVIVIRRLVDRQHAYTALFLPSEEPRVFPTSDYEHGRILQIYKQDRPYAGVHNDFSDFGLGPPPGKPVKTPE